MCKSSKSLAAYLGRRINFNDSKNLNLPDSYSGSNCVEVNQSAKIQTKSFFIRAVGILCIDNYIDCVYVLWSEFSFKMKLTVSEIFRHL